MNATRRPPKKPDPRKVAESTAQALKDRLGDPPEGGSFADGVEAHVDFRRRMCPETEVGCNLGDYVETDRPNGEPVQLGGKSYVVRFPAWFVDWFERQNPATLAAMDAGARERLDRAVIRKAWARTWKSAIGAIVASFVAMHWFADQVEWIVEKIPVLREAWQLLKGIGS